MVIGIVATVAVLIGTGVYVLATKPVPSPMNRYLREMPGDATFLDTAVEDVPAVVLGTVSIPWSYETPKPQEYDLAFFVEVGPGPVIAVESRLGTSLYSETGEFRGSRQGQPIGFLNDGCLLTYAGGLSLYAPNGELLWQREPRFCPKSVRDSPSARSRSSLA